MQKQSLSERVADELRKRMLDGRLQPGERIRELVVARQLAVSQGPVREAFKELRATNWFQSDDSSGTRVRYIDAEQAQSVLKLRVCIEREALRCGLARLVLDTSELRKCAKTIERAAITGCWLQYQLSNDSFHRQLIEAAGNDVLMRTWESLMLDARYVAHIKREKVDLAESQREHWSILEAIENRKLTAALRILDKNVLSAH